jgi:putative ABC transport system permease protein
MSWIDGLVHRVRTVLRPGEFAREMDDEMRHHVDLDAMQQRDADRARRRFGNKTYYSEETRNMTWLGLLDVLQQDMRFAWRSLKRNPGVTALVIVTFTLGIGVNAATFSVLDRIYLRPPAGVDDPGTLHRIWWNSPPDRVSPASSYPVMSTLRERHIDPRQVALFDGSSGYRLGGTRAGPLIDALFSTANYFAVLGVRPQLGRFFNEDEARIGAGAPVVVLSDHVWRAHFAADSTVLGREIRLDEHPFTVIGVAAAGFTGLDIAPTDVWIPLASKTDQTSLRSPMMHRYYGTFGVLRASPDFNFAEFERRASLIAHEVIDGSGIRKVPDSSQAMTGSIIYTRGPGNQNQNHVISTRLSAVALIVLVIAAANVVNLLLARATRRRREIAVRLALGVGRWRLTRMLTAETLLLALIAAGASLVAAWWGGTTLRTLLLPNMRFVDGVIDLRVALFTLCIAFVAGIVAGVVPAIQATTPDMTRALKEGAKEGGVQHSRLRASLVVVQAALSVVLLVGASLFVRSLQNVRGLDLGFDVHELVIGTIGFDGGQAPPPPELSARVATIAERIAGRSGVVSTSRSVSVPMGGASYGQFWYGNDSSNSIQQHRPTMYAVDENYFATTGIRIAKGRVFENRDGAAPQVVINQELAALAFPGADPIGQCLRFDNSTSTCYSIVGVAESSRTMSVVEPSRPQYFLPQANMPRPRFGDRYSSPGVLLVRTSREMATRVIAEVNAELKREFPTGYPNARMMTANIESQYRPWRIGAWLFSAFGVLALVVAVLGIYSTVSYGVSQRTHEFGIRIALGARIADVLRLVVGEGLRTVAIGVVVGVGLALAGGKLVASMLYDVKPRAPDVLIAVSLTLLAVAAIAALVPAWRASRVDPSTALRAD